MRELNYELKQMCERNRDGSFATQAARERILSQLATQLHQLGFKHLSADSLRPKHIEALVAHWQAENLSSGTIKNRMSELRWWAQKVGKENVVAKGNDHYGIDKRAYVTNVSKSRTLISTALQLVTDYRSTTAIDLTSHAKGSSAAIWARRVPIAAPVATERHDRPSAPLFRPCAGCCRTGPPLFAGACDQEFMLTLVAVRSSEARGQGCRIRDRFSESHKRHLFNVRLTVAVDFFNRHG